MYFKACLFLCYVLIVLAVKQCVYKRIFKYHKVKPCHRSKLPLIAWKSAFTAQECTKFARETKGFAFNYSPTEVQNSTGIFIYQNCQILGCPELLNSSSLVPDVSFDYYSAFGNLNTTENSTCVKTVGLFKIVEEKLNYTDAIDYCQNLGADLANILSETHTNTLGFLLKTLSGWYKAAYVGFDDINQEGKFETPLGNFLGCTKYRAWSPGHPRKKRKKDDCVILDSERMWRAINCKIKMPFICEFYPESPVENYGFTTYENCSMVKNKRMKDECHKRQELFEIYNTSSRIDQCALLSD